MIDTANVFHNRQAIGYITTIREHLRNRFGYKGGGPSGLIASMAKCFDPNHVPPSESDALATHGDEELRQVLDVFGSAAQAKVGKDSKGKVVPAVYAVKASQRERRDDALVDTKKCIREWDGFRRMLAREKEKGRFSDERQAKFTQFLSWYTNSAYAAPFPCLSRLINILAVLPVGSATVERSFSKMKLIKTRLRNRLSTRNLEWLMLIAMEGPQWLSKEQQNAIITEFRSAPVDRAVAFGELSD